MGVTDQLRPGLEQERVPRSWTDRKTSQQVTGVTQECVRVYACLLPRRVDGGSCATFRIVRVIFGDVKLGVRETGVHTHTRFSHALPLLFIFCH